MKRSSVLLVVSALLLGAACGSGSGSAAGDWCALSAKLDAVAEPDPTDAAAMRASYEEIQSLVADAAEQAPAEIKDAVAASKDGIDALVAALEEADYDLAAVDMAALESVTAEMDDSSATIEAYEAENCGAATTEG